jgi:hypothetical protein
MPCGDQLQLIRGHDVARGISKLFTRKGMDKLTQATHPLALLSDLSTDGLP